MSSDTRLTAMIAEDEAVAKLVESTWPGQTITRVLDDPGHYALMQHDVSPTRARHIVRHGPLRVLCEVKAKREILALAAEADEIEAALMDETAHQSRPGEVSIGDRIRAVLASAYAGMPDRP